MQIPMGVLADRVNLRWLYAGAFTLWSVAQGLMGFATGLTSLIALRVLLGVGEAIYLPGGSKIVSLLFPAGAARAAERIVRRGHTDRARHRRHPRSVDAGPLRLARELLARRLRGADLADPLVSGNSVATPGAAVARGPAPVRSFGQRVLVLVTNRNLLGICLGFFCFDYYWYFLVNWLPDYLVTSRGLTMMRAGIYAALPYLVFGMSEPIGGWIADRLIAAGYARRRSARAS